MSAGFKLVGRRGSPEDCVARSTSVICLPFLCGTCTDAGRYFAIGSDRLTSPRFTMSARIVLVKTLVIEPISKTVLPSSGNPANPETPAV